MSDNAVNTERSSLASLAKAELHAHLEGTVEYGTLQTLASKNRINLEAPIKLGSSGKVIDPANCIKFGKGTAAPRNFDGNFEAFIAIYLKISECIKTSEDIVLIAERYLESAKQQAIQHSQLYFTPTTFQLFDTPLEPLFEGLVAAQKLAERAYGASISWIFDIVRNSAGREREALPGRETVELALAAKRIGVDVRWIALAGYENLSDGRCAARNFAATFDYARSEGFKILAHAGESKPCPGDPNSPGSASLRDALELLRPERIGHGISAIDDPKLFELLVNQQIPIEVSPWSNITLGLTTAEEHPLVQMVREGLNVVLCSDDPGIFGYDLTDNYLFAKSAGVSEDILQKIARNSLQLAKSSA